MNSIILTGQRNKVALRMRQRIGTLTINEILYQKDKTRELVKRLQRKLKKAKERIIKIITDF
jgi:hypothetical protein